MYVQNIVQKVILTVLMLLEVEILCKPLNDELKYNMACLPIKTQSQVFQLIPTFRTLLSVAFTAHFTNDKWDSKNSRVSRKRILQTYDDNCKQHS